MAVLKKCCCGCGLSTGVEVLAWFEMFINIFAIILLAVSIAEHGSKNDQINLHHISSNGNVTDWTETTTIINDENISDWTVTPTGFEFENKTDSMEPIPIVDADTTTDDQIKSLPESVVKTKKDETEFLPPYTTNDLLAIIINRFVIVLAAMLLGIGASKRYRQLLLPYLILQVLLVGWLIYYFIIKIIVVETSVQIHELIAVAISIVFCTYLCLVVLSLYQEMSVTIKLPKPRPDTPIEMEQIDLQEAIPLKPTINPYLYPKPKLNKT